MSVTTNYKLLEGFRSLFDGVEYRHRDSTRGDFVASFLVDDLYLVGRSAKLRHNVDNGLSVTNSANRTVGKQHRRGDGLFGASIPGVVPSTVPPYVVNFGSVATVEVGTETKILAKAMIKQLDRVGTDMINQAAEFRRHGNNPVCVGVIGVNYAPQYRSLEGEREWLTTGLNGHKHPIQEAETAESRLVARVTPHFDEVIVLRFSATNQTPFDFQWLDAVRTSMEYGATLVRLSRLYEQRF